jgi:hypothetical protein
MCFSTAALSESSVDAILKLGSAPSSQITNNPTGNDAKRYEADPGYSISPEAYFYFTDNLGVGIGYSQMFERYIKGRGDLISSNFYFVFRPKIKVIEKEFVYLIGQIGFSMMDHNFEVNNEELDNATGLYYGVGAGVDIHNFIFELLYTSNKVIFKSLNSDYEEEDEYTMMTINIGYRFSMPLSKKATQLTMTEELSFPEE